MIIINTTEFENYPSFATEGSSGMDLKANIPERKKIEIPSLHRSIVPTGLYSELEPGTELQIRPRSGLAAKKGLTVLNSPGTIDSDYRGEIGVILVNLSPETVTIEHGDRIAQMVAAMVITDHNHHIQFTHCEKELVDDFVREHQRKTDRGSGGYGSTGNK